MKKKNSYLDYGKEYWYFFLLGPILMIGEVIADVQLPAMVGDLINQGALSGDKQYIMTQGLKMFGMVIFAIAAGVGAAYCAARASIGFGANLRKGMFEKIQKFSFSNIDYYSTGSLVTRLTNDVTQVQNMINMGMRMMLRAPGMLIGAVVMAFSINNELAVLFVILIPVLIAIVAFIMKLAFPRFTKMQTKIDKVNSTIQEALMNIRVIKSFVREDFEEERFEETNQSLMSAGLKAFRVVIFQMPIMTILLNISTLFLIYLGGKRVIAGTMLVGDLTALVTYMTQILISLMFLAMLFLQSTRALASVKRIGEVMNTKLDVADSEHEQKDEPITSGEIEFKNVSFGYYKQQDQEVLKNISFHIQSGETVGIVGSTGCGKSSLVQLIPRLYNPDQGEILVGGKSIDQISFETLRNSIAMVLQKNVLFSGTIEENLRWGDEHASMEQIRHATQISQADSFVTAMPDGYQTMLGQGGVNLSGGQKQRLCIARAILKLPKILILDDSTSAVDTATEKFIQSAFSNELKEVTKLIIAQRISSVREADKILVMNEGEIVGQGTHEELLASCNEYQEIYSSQMERGVSA